MFFFKTNLFRIKDLLNLKKLKKKSNGSNFITVLKQVLPIQYKYKRLLKFKKFMSGRSKSGFIVLKSKGKRIKKKLPNVNYNFRSTLLFFNAGFNFINYTNNIYCTIINSIGEVNYIPIQYNNFLFLLSRLKKKKF